MQFLVIASLVQMVLVAMTLSPGGQRLAPGQWMPLGIATVGMVCAAVVLAGAGPS